MIDDPPAGPPPIPPPSGKKDENFIFNLLFVVVFVFVVVVVWIISWVEDVSTFSPLKNKTPKSHVCAPPFRPTISPSGVKSQPFATRPRPMTWYHKYSI